MTTFAKTAALAAATACTALMLAAFAAQAAEPAPREEGPWMVRLRGLAVLPDESASVTPLGGDVAIDDDYVPELDITYFVTDHIAAELVLGTTRHDVTWQGTGTSLPLGKVSLLPPTLLLQYHFLPDERVRPYAGAGINYTIFYNEDAPGGAVNSIDYDDSFGWALQAGVDVALGEGWFANIDVKKLFLNTDVSINGGAITADVDIDPWLVGAGIGYRF